MNLHSPEEIERRLAALEAKAHKPVQFDECPMCSALCVGEGLNRHMMWHDEQIRGSTT